MRKPCKFEECNRPIVARDMCSLHYYRWRYSATEEEKSSLTPAQKRISHYKETGEATCTQCGLHKNWTYTLIKHPKGDYRGLKCTPCVNRNSKMHRQRNPQNTTYYKTLEGRVSAMVSNAKYRITKRGLPCTITPEWVLKQYVSQDGKCFYTGWELEKTVTGRGLGRNPRGMSLERINSSEGYTENNTRLICWAVNRMKSSLPLDVFLDACAAVTDRMDAKV